MSFEEFISLSQLDSDSVSYVRATIEDDSLSSIEVLESISPLLDSPPRLQEEIQHLLLQLLKSRGPLSTSPLVQQQQQQLETSSSSCHLLMKTSDKVSKKEFMTGTFSDDSRERLSSLRSLCPCKGRCFTLSLNPISPPCWFLEDLTSFPLPIVSEINGRRVLGPNRGDG
jgi:hypothetical protein